MSCPYVMDNFRVYQEDGKIIQIDYKADNNLDIEFWLVDDEERDQIRNRAIAFVNGHTNKFRVWSDYDPEEPSTDFYMVVESGALKPMLITEMEALILHLLHDKFDVYHVRIEDDLL